MAKLQAQFITFNDTIKMGTYEENATLKEKRDLLINELRNSLTDEKIPDTNKPLTFSKIDLGSYAMNTGVKPTSSDYDIDVGIIFNITNDEYDSNKLKKLVFDKLNKHHKRTVEFNKPCITVNYASGYHVDLAIYSKNNESHHIAWGKEHSIVNRKWWIADPKGLKQWVSNVATEAEHKKQFRRIARFLKKWKAKAFRDNGNNAPPSIGLTIQARKAFRYQEGSDLEALIAVVQSIKNSFNQTLDLDSGSQKSTIHIELPVQPYKNVYYKMTENQQDTFYNQVVNLLEAIEAARDEASEHECSKILRKVFGNDFPLVEDSKQTNTAPYVLTGTSA
ncbi:nucleotidyltransferase [Pseudoalteromonas sp. SR44-2]|uniref:nucleotidyltransferase domain-containing protein n=1 Tax=Pseudoalteromonas sp. SR44-2 TaxID=2760937 RepID=UPI0016032AB0|nr:nucleotidyltransferase [Pseudoalteromonas sp. SR44-2]MBB1339294.1 nucleotidyltransferase [Pseudoalteromonas sp. SR44-2]